MVQIFFCRLPPPNSWTSTATSDRCPPHRRSTRLARSSGLGWRNCCGSGKVGLTDGLLAIVAQLSLTRWRSRCARRRLCLWPALVLVVAGGPVWWGIILPPSGGPDHRTSAPAAGRRGGTAVNRGARSSGQGWRNCCGSGQSGADRWVARRGRSRLALAISLRSSQVCLWPTLVIVVEGGPVWSG